MLGFKVLPNKQLKQQKGAQLTFGIKGPSRFFLRLIRRQIGRFGRTATSKSQRYQVWSLLLQATCLHNAFIHFRMFRLLTWIDQIQQGCELATINYEKKEGRKKEAEIKEKQGRKEKKKKGRKRKEKKKRKKKKKKKEIENRK